MSSLFRCNLVKKNCGDFCLENVSFNLEPGYIMGVIGENGVGKTTLLRCILGSYHLTGDGNEGSMELMGKDQTKDMPEYKGKIGYVLQDSPFNHLMTAKEVGRVYGRYYDGFDMEKYESLLTKYEVPFEEKEKYRSLHQMSKGQRIRQQLAFALSYDAKLLIFDEATGNLDVEFREALYDEIRQIVSTGEKSVIYATHLVEELEEFADYILWLQKKDDVGHVRYLGTVDDLRDKYRMVEADSNILNSIDESLRVSARITETNKEELICIDGVAKGKIPEEILQYCRYADLKEIMYYVEKAEEGE